MSTRPRSTPWFRTPGVRYELALLEHTGAQLMAAEDRFYEKAREPLCIGGRIEEPVANPDRARFKGGTMVLEEVYHFYMSTYCEQCMKGGDDVRERVGTVVIDGVVRLRATLCDKCATLLP